MINPYVMRAAFSALKDNEYEVLHMFLSHYISQLKAVLYIAPVILLAITSHECAHGKVSDKLGDPTPRSSGRLSLNPLRHIDPFGAICMLFFHIGWAKPVPIDPRYYRDRKKGIIMVSLAGPLTNLILAFASLILKGVLIKYGSPSSSIIFHGIILSHYSASINIGLALFNLVPVPPLDGSKVLGELFPKVYSFYYKWQPYWRFILFALVITGIIGRPLSMLNNGIMNVLWKIVELLLGI